MLPVAVAPSFSDDNACTVRYVLPVLWMTSCFHIVGQIHTYTYSYHIDRLIAIPHTPTGDEVISANESDAKYLE